MTIKRAKELVQNAEMEEIDAKEREKRAELNLEGYTWKEEKVTYGGIQEIWLIVPSEKRQISDLKKLEKNLKKAKDKGRGENSQELAERIVEKSPKSPI